MHTPSRNASIYSMETNKTDLEHKMEVFNLSRRRSRAVLTELSGRYVQNKGRNKLRTKAYQPYNNNNSLPLYKSSSLEGSCLILHYGTFRKVWDCIILTAIMYVALIVPYNAAFNRHSGDTCDRTTLIVPYNAAFNR